MSAMRRTPYMSLATHEVVWSLGANAGRRTHDVEGAFLDAVAAHGKRVFPASSARESDPWFDEFFEAFRDGFRSSR